jgi:hypothetical protein
MENGRNVLVNDHNKEEYIKRYSNFKMTTEIEHQTKAFV